MRPGPGPGYFRTYDCCQVIILVPCAMIVLIHIVILYVKQSYYYFLLGQPPTGVLRPDIRYVPWT